MTEGALKPCPFCGSEVVVFLSAYTSVKCEACGGFGPDHGPDAPATWNDRPAEDRARDRPRRAVELAEAAVSIAERKDAALVAFKRDACAVIRGLLDASSAPTRTDARIFLIKHSERAP